VLTTRTARILFLAGVLCLAVVVVLSILLWHSSRPPGIDRFMRRHITQKFGTSLHTVAATVNSSLTAYSAGWTAVLLAGAAWATRRRWAAVIAALAVPLVVHLAEEGLKRLVARLPPNARPGQAVAGYAWPSGHAAIATCLSVLAVLVLWDSFRSPVARIVLVTTGAIYASVTGWSAIGVGDHFFTDVIGGVALGAGITILLGGLMVTSRAATA
jgi:membrane-associated phospholipid phosphatase